MVVVPIHSYTRFRRPTISWRRLEFEIYVWHWEACIVEVLGDRYTIRVWMASSEFAAALRAGIHSTAFYQKSFDDSIFRHKQTSEHNMFRYCCGFGMVDAYLQISERESGPIHEPITTRSSSQPLVILLLLTPRLSPLPPVPSSRISFTAPAVDLGPWARYLQYKTND